MNKRWHQPDLAYLIRMTQPQKVRLNTLIPLIHKFVSDGMKDRGTTEAFALEVLAKGGDFDTDFLIRQVQRSWSDTATTLLMESIQTFMGVTIHVEDENLARAILRTRLDAFVKDVRLPYPCMEITCPAGISLPDINGYELSGCIVFSMKDLDISAITKRNGWNIDLRSQGGGRKSDIVVLSRPIKDGKPGNGVCMHGFSTDDILAHDDESPALMEEDEKKAILAQARFAMGLMLYLQSLKDRQARARALQDIPPPRRDGLPGSLMGALKKAKHLRVVDITAPARSEGGTGHNVTGRASPAQHWRAGTMRALRDDRFHRNDDGSVKIIWVRPCQVGYGDEEMPVQQRVVPALATA